MRSLGKQDLLMVPIMRDEVAALARGETAAVVSTSVAGADSMVRSRAPIKALVMKEGTVINKSIGVPSVRKDMPDFSSEGTRITPVRLLVLDEAANKLAAQYVTEGPGGQINGHRCSVTGFRNSSQFELLIYIWRFR